MDNFDKFYAASLNYLSYRVRSVKEMRDYLLEKNSPPEISDKIITKLISQKFLNDEEFARMWIESRNRANPRSTRVLKLELQQKGISKDITDSLLNSEIASSDLESAKRLVQKRLPRMRSLEKDQIYQKLGGFLVRKGYTWGVIKNSIDDCLREEYNEH